MTREIAETPSRRRLDPLPTNLALSRKSSVTRVAATINRRVPSLPN